MKKLIIVGAANPTIIEVVKDINSMGDEQYEILGFLDNNYERIGSKIWGYNLLGPLSCAKKYVEEGVCFINVIAGTILARQETTNLLLSFGAEFETIIHPSVVNMGLTIGKGTIIYPGAVIQPEVQIGNHCIVSSLSGVAHETKIGDYVFVGPNAYISGKVFVDDGVYIGVGANILPRLRIGKNSIVGAGSLINKDITDKKTVWGIPGREIR